MVSFSDIWESPLLPLHKINENYSAIFLFGATYLRSILVCDLASCYKEPWSYCMCRRQFFLTSLRVLSILFPYSLKAILIGNPAEPALETCGIFTEPNSWCSLRASFFEDYVYRQKFKDEFQLENCDQTKTFAKLSTNAGMLILNFKSRIDLYGIAGASRLQVNQEIYSKMQLCWGIGGKIVIFQTSSFYLGADIKYFETDQKPLYFLCEGLPFNLAGNFELKYTETLCSLGMCWQTSCIAPYIYATYMIAKFNPDPLTALVRWPFSDVLVDAVCKSAISQRRFGFAIGATLISKKTAVLSVESRMFNQNAIDVSLEVRF